MKKKLLAGLANGLFLFGLIVMTIQAEAGIVQITYSGQFGSSYEDQLRNQFPTAGIADGQKYYGTITYDEDSPMLFESGIGFGGRYRALSATLRYAGLTWSAGDNNQAITLEDDRELSGIISDRFFLNDYGDLLLNGQVIGTTNIWIWWKDDTHSSWDTYISLPTIQEVNNMNVDSTFFRWKIWINDSLVIDVVSLPLPMTATIVWPPQNKCRYQGDFDCDGDIDGVDLEQFSKLYGEAYIDPYPFIYPTAVPKSGQTASYDTGDDGDLQKGIPWPNPRFTINVNEADDDGSGNGIAGNGICDGTEICNGTVTDRMTGLVWLRNANCAGTYRNWPGALSEVAKLNTDGTMGIYDCGDISNGGSHQTDWRLPNKREIISLMADQYCSPALSNADGTGQWTEGDAFTRANMGSYWTSTTYPGDTSQAWYALLGQGGLAHFDKETTYSYVWPVRGGDVIAW